MATHAAIACSLVTARAARARLNEPMRREGPSGARRGPGQGKSGGPDRTRTGDLALRKRSHYPCYATGPAGRRICLLMLLAGGSRVEGGVADPTGLEPAT